MNGFHNTNQQAKINQLKLALACQGTNVVPTHSLERKDQAH